MTNCRCTNMGGLCFSPCVNYSLCGSKGRRLKASRGLDGRCVCHSVHWCRKPRARQLHQALFPLALGLRLPYVLSWLMYSPASSKDDPCHLPYYEVRGGLPHYLPHSRWPPHRPQFQRPLCLPHSQQSGCCYCIVHGCDSAEVEGETDCSSSA